MPTCHNCKAEVPKCGTDPRGNPICCAACLFNPLGCRCKYGELGVVETQQYLDDDDYAESDDNDDGEDFDCGMMCDSDGKPEGCSSESVFAPRKRFDFPTTFRHA